MLQVPWGSQVERQHKTRNRWTRVHLCCSPVFGSDCMLSTIYMGAYGRVSRIWDCSCKDSPPGRTQVVRRCAQSSFAGQLNSHPLSFWMAALSGFLLSMAHALAKTWSFCFPFSLSLLWPPLTPLSSWFRANAALGLFLKGMCRTHSYLNDYVWDSDPMVKAPVSLIGDVLTVALQLLALTLMLRGKLWDPCIVLCLSQGRWLRCKVEFGSQKKPSWWPLT